MGQFFGNTFIPCKTGGVSLKTQIASNPVESTDGSSAYLSMYFKSAGRTIDLNKGLPLNAPYLIVFFHHLFFYEFFTLLFPAGKPCDYVQAGFQILYIDFQMVFFYFLRVHYTSHHIGDVELALLRRCILKLDIEGVATRIRIEGEYRVDILSY